MSPEELESYNVQLEQVNLALSQDPDNAELTRLRQDLIQLIDLTKAFLESQANSVVKLPAEKKAAPVFKVGDQCMAKWSDGEYYQAVVSAKTLVGDETMYSVVFVGYNNVELFKPGDLKPCSEQSKRPQAPIEAEEVKPKKKKRKPYVPKPVGPTKAETEQKKKQDVWLKFAKKNKVKAPPINQKSIFQTPDNPLAKVGVIGSGNPMTQFAQRGKHYFPKK